MADELAALASAPDAPDRADRIGLLVECPQPLAPLLSSLMREADPPVRRALLETMARRYHRLGTLSPFTEESAAGVSFLCADHERDGLVRRLATAFVDLEQVGAATRALAELAGRTGDSTEFVADFYAAPAGPARSPDELAATLRQAIAEAALPARVQSVVFAVTEPARGSRHVCRGLRELSPD